jgi:hypothetical protein
MFISNYLEKQDEKTMGEMLAVDINSGFIRSENYAIS